MTAAMENGPLGRAVQSEGRIWHIVPEHTSLVHRTDPKKLHGSHAPAAMAVTSRWTPSPSPETCSFCQWKSKPSQSPAVLPRRNATTALRLRWEVFQFQLEQIPSNTARKWWT
ncbi:hypothetical protein KC323_g257 [Hortaea werneckii]|nr:hypothetical protein KC323_g257 [Hortaea werneckii]